MRDLNTNFAQLIGELVEDARFSKSELANRLSCSRSTIYEILDGRNSEPRWAIGEGIIQLHDYHVKGIRD